MSLVSRFALTLSTQLLVMPYALAQVVPADNDASATFDGRTFNLPDVSDPKDTYTIVVKSAGKDSELKLPAGATALRLTPSAIPKSPWSWRYVLTKVQLPAMQVMQPQEGRVTYSQLARYDSGVLLLWKTVPGSDRYKVTVAVDKATSLSKLAEWGKESSEDMPDDAVDTGCGCVHYVRTSKPGERFRWKATALAADGTPIAETEYRQVAVDEPWSKELSGKGFQLQRSDTLAKDLAGKPALFGYQSNQKEGSARASAYLAQFAVVWSDKDSQDGKVFYPRVSLEAKLTSSGSDKANDAIRLRAGGYEVVPNWPLNLTTNLKYDTERKSGTKKGSFELIATPTFAPFARYYPRPSPETTDAAGNFSSLPWLQVMPTILLGAEAGRTLDVGSSQETTKNLARGRVDLRFDAQLNFLSAALRLPQVNAYAESTYWRLGHQDANEFTYSTTGLSFKLTQDVSLDLTYSVGRDAPTFNFTRSGAVSLGLQIK